MLWTTIVAATFAFAAQAATQVPSSTFTDNSFTIGVWPGALVSAGIGYFDNTAPGRREPQSEPDTAMSEASTAPQMPEAGCLWRRGLVLAVFATSRSDRSNSARHPSPWRAGTVLQSFVQAVPRHPIMMRNAFDPAAPIRVAPQTTKEVNIGINSSCHVSRAVAEPKQDLSALVRTTGADR